MKKILLVLLTIISIQAYSQSMHGLTYSIALPLGETSDFTGNLSWRGFAIDGKYFVNDNMTLGWTTGWHTMYESESGSFTEGTRTLTGTQYRYINVLPIMMTYNFFFNNEGDVQPFLGLSAGTYWIEQKTNMGLFSDVTDHWHFGIAPEVGILFPAGLRANFYATFRYNNAIAADDSINFSFLALNIGFLWY